MRRFARQTTAACLAVTLGAVVGIPARANAAPAPTDEDARRAVGRAVAWLYARQDRQGRFGDFTSNPHSREYVGGGEALVLLAMLRAGEEPGNVQLARTVQFLRLLRPEHTYVRALRAMAMSYVPGPDARKLLLRDVAWLTTNQDRTGGWGYGPGSLMTRQRPEWTDASNSQFALLALREAFDAGVTSVTRPLVAAEKYWSSFQNPDGGWGYQPSINGRPPQRGPSHGSMTAAALASCLILADRLGAVREAAYRPGPMRRPAPPTLLAGRMDSALKWLGDHYDVAKVPQFIWVAQPSQLGYYLFCLQRAGDAAGRWDIAGNDYSAQITQALLAAQKADGSWGGSIIDTSFAALTLLKAAAPVVMAQLDLGADGDRFCRESENVARYLTRRLRRPVAWRQVSPNQPDLLRRTPLLLVQAPADDWLAEPVAKAMVDYVRNGGTLAIQVGPSGPAAALIDAVGRLFPDYSAATLPDNHPLWSLRDAVAPSNRPAVTGIGDRCRTRIFVFADDVTGAWRQGRTGDQPDLFRLAGNLVLYAFGGRLPAGKFRQCTAPPATPAVTRHIGVARVKYKGDYDVCPMAIPHLGRRLAHSLPVGLKALPPVDLAAPIDKGVSVLWLTGNVPPALSEPEMLRLRDFLDAGGMLLIDPAIGRADFHTAAAKLVSDLCGADHVAPLPADHPLMTGHFAGGLGADLSRLKAPTATAPRPATATAPTTTTAPATAPAPPAFLAGTVNGRVAVVLSRFGLTCSIEGAPCVENLGYSTNDASRIALNVILHTASAKAN